VKRWGLGVGVTMEVKRWSLGVGRSWGYPKEGFKMQSIAENDHGYAITCLMNLLTTSERVFLEKLIVPQRVKKFPRCMETDVSLDLTKPRHLSPTSARLINLLKLNDIYICRTAALTSRRYILNIYSTNIHTEYFKHAA